MKRTLLFAMAVCIFTLTAPNYAATSGDYEYTDNGNGTCTITDYLGPGGDVTIPDTLNGLMVTMIGSSSFRNNSTLTSLVVSDSVVTIGYSAFSGCSNLAHVTIGNNVTIIKNSAFRDCSRLTTIAFGNSIITIEDNAFLGCIGFTDITIPESVISIGRYAFYHCTALTDIAIPDNVTTLGDYAFSTCSSLTDIYIGNKLISLGYRVFYGCSTLQAITVDVLNPAYSSLHGVLFNKNQTELIQYPSGKTGIYAIPDNVTTLGDWSFSGCAGLTQITIPDSVTTINIFAFYNCSSLTSIMIPDSVTGLERSVFDGCSSLTCVTIGNSVNSIDSVAFLHCSNLTGLYFKGDVPVNSPDALYLYTGTSSSDLLNATVYFLPGIPDWGTTYSGLPTAVWPTSIADIDVNGDVNLWDFAIFAAAWQSTSGQPEYNPLCDISNPVDGIINTADLDVLADNWLITPCP